MCLTQSQCFDLKTKLQYCFVVRVEIINKFKSTKLTLKLVKSVVIWLLPWFKVGPLADWYGRQKAFVLSMFFYAVFTITSAFG